MKVGLALGLVAAMELSKIQIPSLSDAAKNRKIVFPTPLRVESPIDCHTTSLFALVNVG